MSALDSLWTSGLWSPGRVLQKPQLNGASPYGVPPTGNIRAYVRTYTVGPFGNVAGAKTS